MGSARLATALALLLALSAPLFFLAPHSAAPEPLGRYGVTIIGPGQQVLVNATVESANATAFTVLREAAGQAGLAVEVETYPSFGPGCGGIYVRAVGPYHAEGSAGWLYRVRVAASGAWVHGPYSAACFVLHAGDHVEWRWGTA